MTPWIRLAAALALLLAACATQPTSSATTAPTAPPPTATPAPSPTADLAQVQAVASRIFPKGPAQDCFNGGVDGCPFTPRLKARMQVVLTSVRADPVCRCQNGYQSSAITAEVVDGQPVAHVVLTFGTSSVKMDWVFARSGGAWLADDAYCTAQGPSTSIYTGAAPCSG
jgi:hypothetical protein